MRYKEYSKTQLEAHANLLNNEFDEERLKKAKPIDVYDVLDFIKADVDWKYLSTDQSILGATIFCDGILPVFEKLDTNFDKRYIKVNAGTIIIDCDIEESPNVGRKNFTVMYEAFHFLYHKSSFLKRNGGLKNVLNTEVFRPYEEKKRGMTAMEILEWQANYMAAAFLIPQKALLNEIHTIYPQMMDEVGRIPFHVQEKEIKELSELFSVSRQTMNYRIKSLQRIG